VQGTAVGITNDTELQVSSLVDSAEVVGGNPINGTVEVSGFKIAAIPIIAATILTEHPVELINLPVIKDVEVLLHLIESMRGNVEKNGCVTRICTASLRPSSPLPAEIVTSVHGTLYLLPVLLARFGEVRINRTQGGCSIGERPIHHIVAVMEKMGARVRVDGDDIVAEAMHLRGAVLSAQFSGEWDKFRSGATKTALLIGVCAQGLSVINDAYHRASIIELVAFLRCLGADVTGEGTSRLIVRGGKLHGGRFRLEGDYLEALTYLALVAASGGTIEVRGFNPENCRAELSLLSRMGLCLREEKATVFASHTGRLRAASFTTRDIDTDIQPVMAAALARAEGRSVIEEKVWEDRFRYCSQLNKMGARAQFEGNRLVIDGVADLNGAAVQAFDLRAAAALLIAASGARGKSVISGLSHLQRGYQSLLDRMRALGVDIRTRHPIS